MKGSGYRCPGNYATVSYNDQLGIGKFAVEG